MRLKSLELIGFKSFADRTVLDFGEGISAIVGPNGCGKSNISDSIRWVLGEQSARLLRGTAMQDCIFNGTDASAPKNMAEVSLCLTDCEQVLGTDYHEVTVTRRVFRSGEGQYFINKTPCRLKDIQRLFLDTGIGTNSYSVMEQGRIDLILRARPEDRREVFEEASGIAKYKADKREAMRKLEQTENNLLRLADIIKEVKRQIISIQRQAGKAERYKKMFDQLRGHDVYAARERLQLMASEIAAMDTQHASIVEKNEALQHDIERFDLDNIRLQEERAKIEGEISALQQAAMQVESQIEQLRQSIEVNKLRLDEHRQLIRHDSREIETARKDLDGVRASSAQIENNLKNAETKFSDAEENLKIKGGQNARHEEEIDRTKHRVQELMTESLTLDGHLTKSQNELQQLESTDRVVVIRRERCAAEQAGLRLALKKHQERVDEAEKTVQSMLSAVDKAEQDLRQNEDDIRKYDEQVGAAQSEIGQYEREISALTAQVEMLGEEASAKSTPRADADELKACGIDRENILGRLYEQVKVHQDYRVALEAVLRDLLDAYILKDVSGAIRLVSAMDRASELSMSFVVADLPSVPAPKVNPPPQSTCLLDQVQCPDQFRPLFTRLLQNAYIVESADFLGRNADQALVCVTKNGVVMRGTGALQVGTGISSPEESPILRQQRREEFKARLLAQEEKLALARESCRKLIEVQKKQKDIFNARRAELEVQRLALAGHQGQHGVIKGEADKTADNLETVSEELKEIEKQGSSTDRKSELITAMDSFHARRVAVKHELDELNGKIKVLEQTHKELQGEVIKANVNAVRYREEVSHLAQTLAAQKERIAQLEALVGDRGARIHEYEQAIKVIENSSREAVERLPVLQEQLKTNAAQIVHIKETRDKLLVECKHAEEKLKQLRGSWEAQRNQQGDLNGKIIELRMRREHLLERITGDYHLTEENITHAAEPEWGEGGKPSTEQLDALIGDLRAKIEAMGPVNTGAIEEMQQLQERYEFLSKQQEDLVNARQQLMDAIRKINQTTTEMFSKTFAQINENFQIMFSQLFGGGSAKLILTDEGDILECGIEIFARPPGKKLQSISLLSGGESTMTAVALLFAIFMVKPSPFCVLDELDAPLDDANNQRFINMLKGFLKNSQFIVITHNRQTIAAAGVLYGVTMEKDKISTIVSMRFKGDGKAPAPVAQTDASQPQPDRLIIQAKN